VTDQMRTRVAEAGDTGNLLDTCFGRIDSVLIEIEAMKFDMESAQPDLNERYDTTEVERLFSASYTTEMERDVLRAAITGAALPLAQPEFAGNNVELF